MKNLFFWNNWKRPYNHLYLFLFSLLILSLILYVFSYFIGIDAVISWDIKPTFDSIKVSIDQFTKGLFNYSVDTNNYLIREKYFASDIKVNPLFSYIYFSLVMIGVMLALTVLTRIELIGYAMGMGLFIFFLVYLHTEFLGILGTNSKKFTLLIIMLYGGLSFYFQAYDKRFTFIQRFLSFLILTIGLAIVIGFTAKVEDPFLYMANYGLVVPVILTVIFITAIAFDIIGGFVFITSGSKAIGKNTIMHFSLISLLYITNLLLIYLKKKGILAFGFVYVDVFFIYIISAVIGIWGLKKRAPLFKNIIQESHASFLYIAFALISTATITYAFITGNDPLTEAFQHAILYSHLGMGIVFFLYILYNFWELFYKQISAYDLMYVPRRMPFFMVRPLGLVIMLSFFMQSGMFPYKLAKGGYFNAIGDIYLYQGKLKEAKEAYSEGSIYGTMNRRSNYCMGTVLTKLDEKQQAAEYYTKSLEKYPTDFTYVNLSNIFIDNDQFFPAFFALKDGLNKFPESGILHNNIAILYSSKGIWDSTLYHLEKAKIYLDNNETVSSNIVWFLARNRFYKEADSILQVDNFKNHIPFQNNKLAIYNLTNKKVEDPLNTNFVNDTVLNGQAYSYFYNYGINNIRSKDEVILNKIDSYLKYEGNLDYHDQLSFLKCLKLYYSGNKSDGIKALKDLNLRVSTESALYYNRVLGLWAIEQEAFAAAAEYFKNATSLTDPETQYNRAVALLEAGNPDEGMEILYRLRNTPQADIKKACENLILIFESEDLSKVNTWSDTLKFQFLHLRKYQLSNEAIKGFYNIFKSKEIQILAGSEILKHFIDINDSKNAEEIWKNVSAELSDNKLKKSFSAGELNYQYLRLLELKQDWNSLITNSKSIFINKSQEPNRIYFLALSEDKLGYEKEAEKKYQSLLKTSPYNANAFIKVAEYYNKKENPTTAYDVLVEGLALNETSAELYMAYALQALKMNMTNYAEESLDNIQELTSPQKFAAFMEVYKKEKEISEKQFQNF